MDASNSSKNLHYKRFTGSANTGSTNNVLVPVYLGNIPGRISRISGTGSSGAACSGRVVVIADQNTYYSETVSLGSSATAVLTTLDNLPFREVEIYAEKTGGSNWISFSVSYELQTEE